MTTKVKLIAPGVITPSELTLTTATVCRATRGEMKWQ